MENIKIILIDTFIEELELTKLNKNELEISHTNDKDLNGKAITVELAGDVLSSENNEKRFRYILAVNIVLEDQFKISLVYDSYFDIECSDENDLKEENLAKEFNEYVWPFVIEQVHNITSKMNLDKKITLPPLSVMSDED